MDNHRENPREFGWIDSSDSDRDHDIDEEQDRIDSVRPRSPPRRRIARGPVIRFNSRTTHNYRRFWRECLIGTFIDCRKFPVRRLQAIVDNCWRLRGPVRVVGSSRNNYLFHFSSIEDRMFVLEEGPWSLQGGLMHFSPWEPNLVLINFSVSDIAVWVQLWGIPLEF